MPRSARTFETFAAASLTVVFCGALACERATPAPPATPPVVALPAPSMSASPPVAKGPLVIERTATPAPWLERPSEPLPFWAPAPKARGQLTEMIDPVLGETRAIAVEPNLLVVGTAVGQLLRRPERYVGVVTGGLTVTGVTKSGKVILARAGGTDVVADSPEAAAAAKARPAPWPGRALDASGVFVLAVAGDGALTRSSDEGATFTPVAGLGTNAPVRGWIRSDGVALVETKAKAERDRFFVVNVAGKAQRVGRVLLRPGRLGGTIYANDTRLPETDAIKHLEVLASDGTTWNETSPPAAFTGAGYVSFHPILLDPPTMRLARAWPGTALADAPSPKPRAGNKAKARSTMSLADAQSEYGLIGVLNASGTGADEPPKNDCKGLSCFAGHRPFLYREVGSLFGARFFDDAVCAGTGATCTPGPLARPPTIGFFRRDEGLVGFVRAPADCDPEHVWSARGLVVLDCRGARFVADRSMNAQNGGLRFVAETRPTPGVASWEPQMAGDGTLLVVARKEGRIHAAQVRRPDAAGAPAAWRSLVLGDANRAVIEAFPLDGDGALLVLTNAAGDRLTLVIDDHGTQTVAVRDVRVDRPVMRIFFEKGAVHLGFADEDTPRALTVHRDGTLAPAETPP